MAVHVGRWDCPTCGNKGVLGPETKCPNCGAPRPKDVRFYLPTDAELVQDEARIKEAEAGVDWICGHCTSQNKAVDTLCFSCGNPRDESSDDVDLQEREYGSSEVPTDSFAPKRTRHPLEEPKSLTSNRRSPVRKFLIAAVLILVGIFALRSFPTEIDVSVEQFSWQRDIQMLHYEPVQQEAWDRAPSDAFDVRSSREIKTYNQVLRGYETKTRTRQVQVGTERYVCGKIDKGNGYFVDKYCTRPVYESRQETYKEPVYDQVPVYGTKYYFKTMKWVKANVITAKAKDHSPQWPNPPPQADADKWKQGDRQEVYFIFVKEDDGDVHKEKIPYDVWSKLEIGSILKAKRSLIFDIYYGLK
ncbi:MAG: Ran-binding zinc finger domain-containing protein [Bacteroidota bacterium]